MIELTAKIVAGVGMETGRSKTDRAWWKGSVVVEYGDRYPKKVLLTYLTTREEYASKAHEFANLPVGTEYKFMIDIESREYNGRWYTTTNAVSWQPTQFQPTPTYQQPPQQQYAPPQQGFGTAPQQPAQGFGATFQPYQPPQQQGFGATPQPAQPGDDLPF